MQGFQSCAKLCRASASLSTLEIHFKTSVVLQFRASFDAFSCGVLPESSGGTPAETLFKIGKEVKEFQLCDSRRLRKIFFCRQLPCGGSHLTPKWTSRDSNYHRMSVSASKANATSTEPSGRFPDGSARNRKMTFLNFGSLFASMCIGRLTLIPSQHKFSVSCLVA